MGEPKGNTKIGWREKYEWIIMLQEQNEQYTINFGNKYIFENLKTYLILENFELYLKH